MQKKKKKIANFQVHVYNLSFCSLKLNLLMKYF